MTIRVSGKHMDIGDTFRTRIKDHISDAVTKYYSGGYSGQVTVEKAGSRFTSDCKVHLDTGIVLQATGQSQDPLQSFEAAAERIEKRIRRYKRKLKNHQINTNPDGFAEVAYSVMGTNEIVEEEVSEDYAPAIVAESTKQLQTMSVASAVMSLDMTDEPLLIFRNPGNDAINVVYRRNDGNIGWIDAGVVKTQ